MFSESLLRMAATLLVAVAGGKGELYDCAGALCCDVANGDVIAVAAGGAGLGGGCCDATESCNLKQKKHILSKQKTYKDTIQKHYNVNHCACKAISSNLNGC